jgi:hypothetical protein
MPADDDDPLRASRIGGIARPSGAPAATAADGADGAEGVQAADRVAAEGVERATAVADALATGAIDSEAALRALVDRAAASMLGPAADPATVEAVRAEVTALLAGDPTLAALLRA